jgi:hypothetical protein
MWKKNHNLNDAAIRIAIAGVGVEKIDAIMDHIELAESRLPECNSLVFEMITVLPPGPRIRIKCTL